MTEDTPLLPPGPLGDPHRLIWGPRVLPPNHAEDD